MALTPSSMVSLGTPAPNFSLPDTISGETVSFSDLKGQKGTLVMFICNHCPFVKHIHPELVRLGKDYQNSEVSIIAISSNDVENYPEDSPEKMKQLASKLGFSFPYLYDQDQKAARAYEAECTPDFFLFDADNKLVYRGQLDDSRPENGIALSGKDLRAAIDAVITGSEVPQDQRPSVGCNIKWKE